MKILHTSDWHIGNTLYDRRRYDEFSAFFDWLLSCITTKEVDVLLVAGDIFDSGTPSNRALSLYYRFLHQVADSCCRHVIITAGNHDSPSLLSAPRDLLRALDIHIIGSVTEQPEDEVILLTADDSTPELIVCAVPYLRDRDVRTAQPGESTDEKREKLVSGIKSHYHDVAERAEDIRRHLGQPVPIIGMGHLYTAGGNAGDGVRDLYIGTLGQVDAGIFPSSFDYLALGHLHLPQMVGGSPYRRYCGSPLPMGFNEAGQQKQVCLVRIEPGEVPVITTLPIPSFIRMERIRGNYKTVIAQLRELAFVCEPVLTEIIIEDSLPPADIQEEIRKLSSHSLVEVLITKTTNLSSGLLRPEIPSESLAELSEIEVFRRCMDAHKTPEEDRQELIDAYTEILTGLYEEDTNAQ